MKKNSLSGWSYCFLFLSLIFLFFGKTEAHDLDNNGLDSAVETQLAKKFQPSFLIHESNILEPEPVEILRNRNIPFNKDQIPIPVIPKYLKPHDVWASVVPFTKTGEDPKIPSGDYPNGLCLIMNNPPCQTDENLHNVDFMAQLYSGDIYRGFFDYGGAGNETESGWRNTYLYGNNYVLPGSNYDPVVYAHFFRSDIFLIEDGALYENVLGIQYWVFYPYNDCWNDHEGDWEHITVFLTSSDPATAEIFLCDYYNHHNVILSIPPAELYVLDETHPVVFVGGGVVQVGGYGESSGASWPWPGNWDNVVDIFGDVATESVFPGNLVHYSELGLKIIPDFREIGGTQGANMDGWFRSNPWNQWMRAKVRFGNFMGLKAPAYQGTWRNRKPEGVSQYNSSVHGPDGDPWHLLFLTCQDSEGKGLFSNLIVSSPSGSEYEKTTPFYRDFNASESGTFTIQAPEIIVSDEKVYIFKAWNNSWGQSENGIVLNFEFNQNSPQKCFQANASYIETCLEEIIVTGPGDILGPSLVYSSGNITLQNISVSGAGTVEYRAANSITLAEGFIAGEGSSFISSIDDYCLQFNPDKTKGTLGFQNPDNGNATDLEGNSTYSPSLQVFPNPFNALLNIKLVLLKTESVRISLYDIKGRLVRRLEDDIYPAGEHTIKWDGISDSGAIVPSGIYFFRIEQGQKNKIGKVTLVK